MRLHGVVRARETGYGIEEYHHVAAVLDLALRHFDDHLGDLDVVLGGFVEGRGKDERLRVALHFGHFLGALVHKEDYEHRVGVVFGDGVRHLLHQDRLARAGRGHDQPALAEADGREDVYDARRKLARHGLEYYAAVGEQRREVFEMHHARRLGRRLAVDLVHVAEGEEAVAVAGVAHGAFHDVAGAQAVAADLLLRHEDVFGTGDEVRLGRAQEAVAVLHRLQHAGRGHGAAAAEV